jgi:cbb3-type cytochrome oxidase maturation protein
MSVMILLIIFSMLTAGVFLLAFFWAAQTGQFEDSITPSLRMLIDDSEPESLPADTSISPLTKTENATGKI